MKDKLNEYKNLSKEELTKEWTKTMNEMSDFLKESRRQVVEIDKKVEILSNEGKRSP